MKILHLITGMAAGGAEHMLYKVLPTLEGEHFVVSLMNLDFWGTPLKKRGVKVKFLGLNKFNILSVTWKLMRIIKKEKPDIINCYLLHTNIYGRFIGKLFRKKVVCSVRNVHRETKFLNFIDKYTQFLVDEYTPNSEAVKEFIINKIGINKKKVRVIPNSIEVEKYNIKIDRKKYFKEFKIPKENKVFGCIGSFKKQKGHTYLIDAFAKLLKKNPNNSLILIGEGKLREEIEAKTRKLGLQNNIKFLGNRKDTPKLINFMNYLVLPSLHEGMPNVLLEAMASKTPILCTNIRENTDLVGDKAIIFPKKDVEALYKALMNPNKKKKNMDYLNKKVKKEYSIKNTQRLMIKLYEELLR